MPHLDLTTPSAAPMDVADRGWTAVFSPHPGATPRIPADITDLRSQRWCIARVPTPPAALQLIDVMTAFFDQDDLSKNAWTDPKGDDSRNYRRLTLGRQGFAIRDSGVPEEVLPMARETWRYFAELGHTMLRDIERDLRLPAGRLTEVCEPAWLPDNPSRSLLRNFRYPACDTPGQVLSDTHADLGILSFCMETVPGLQLDSDPLTGREAPGVGKVTVLVGEALALLTAQAYLPCLHRVVGGARERQALIFHLRLRQDAVLDSQRLRHPGDMPAFRMTGAEFLAWQLGRGPHVNQPIDLADPGSLQASDPPKPA